MRFSIITVVYNRVGSIRRTIESVLGQSFKDFEYIVIDGESTDGTLKYIKNVDSKNFKYVSEKDNGVYDALNKGVRMSRGEYVLFVHSDDYFVDNKVLSNINKHINNQDIIYGNTIYVNQEGEKVRYWKGESGDIKKGWAPCHTATILKKSVYEEIGLYNLDYSIASDYDLMIRAFCDDSNSVLYIDIDIVYMTIGGISTSGIKSKIKSFIEIDRIYRKNNFKRRWFTQYKRLMYRKRQRNV